MSIIYQDTNVLKFLKIAELWGVELNTDMWTVTRKMAEGTKGYKIVANPLIIHHVSMINSDDIHTGKGGFQNSNTISAIETLIEHKTDYPENIIVQGLHDMCITKQNFRLWCVEKYPLPKFWFTEEERNTFSPEEKVQIKRVGKLKLTTKDAYEKQVKRPDSPKSSWFSSTFNMSKIIWWVLGILGAIIAGTLIPHCTKSPHHVQKTDVTSSFQDRLSFIEAAKQGNISVIESLLNKGIDINTIDKDGNTALIEATRHNQRACIQKLIEKGSKVNIKNNDGWTALIVASQNGYKTIAELLIKNGADFNIKANDGNTALTFASYKGYVEIVKILKKSGAITVKYQDSKILTAALKGDINTLKALLEKGVSPNTISRIGGETPLMYAMGQNHYECAELLLEFGADVSIRAKDGYTVLDVIKGRPEMFELIEKYGTKRQ